jgi:hypothetical protein
MNRHWIPVFAAALVFGFLPSAAHAQWTVYDPTNYAQAILRYRQLVQHYEHMVRQARRLPASLTRYRVPEVLWRTHGLAAPLPSSEGYLDGLNYGDAAGALYYQAVDRLERVDDVLSRVPSSLRRRLGTHYATIEVADSVASMGIHQAGAIRFNGRSVLRAIEAMEDDAFASSDDYHTQTALLNKINGAAVLGLRINETTSQFMMHTLEQLLVENKRKRDAEAKLMNATIHQWRYGDAYGEDMFRDTAMKLDSWRQP